MLGGVCSPSTCAASPSPREAHSLLQVYLLLILILEQLLLIGERNWPARRLATAAVCGSVPSLLVAFQEVSDEAPTARTARLPCTSSVVPRWSGFSRFGGVFLASKTTEHKLSDCLTVWWNLNWLEWLKLGQFSWSIPCFASAHVVETQERWTGDASPERGLPFQHVYSQITVYKSSFGRVKCFIRFCICPKTSPTIPTVIYGKPRVRNPWKNDGLLVLALIT